MAYESVHSGIDERASPNLLQEQVEFMKAKISRTKEIIYCESASFLYRFRVRWSLVIAHAFIHIDTQNDIKIN